MSEASQSQLSPEVITLQNLILSARQSSTELWDSVASALNAADATVVASVVAEEDPTVHITSSDNTTAAIRMEDYRG